MSIEYIYIHSAPTPRTGCDTRLIFKRSKADLNLGFTLTGYQTKAKENSLFYYLSTAGRGSCEFMPFPRTLTQNETQTAVSRIELALLILFSTTITDMLNAHCKDFTKFRLCYR